MRPPVHRMAALRSSGRGIDLIRAVDAGVGSYAGTGIRRGSSSYAGRRMGL